MEQTVPATREKNSTQFLPLNGGKPPSISFPLSPMAFARFVAIMSPGVLFRLGRENIGSPAPRKKGKRGLGKGETSFRRVSSGILRSTERISNMINGIYIMQYAVILGDSYLRNLVSIPKCRPLFSPRYIFIRRIKNRFIIFDHFRIRSRFIIFFFFWTVEF